MNQRTNYRIIQLLPAFVLATLLLGALAFAAAAAPVAPAAPAVVTCDPQNSVLLVDEPFSVDVTIDGVEALQAADVQMSFDGDALTAVDADPNTPGVQMEIIYDWLNVSFFLRNVIDQDAGTVHYAAVVVNPTPPASGSGAIFRLSFEGVSQAGAQELAFTSAQLSNGDGVELESVTQDCRVTVVNSLEDLALRLPVILSP